jgi:hypothetical protein
MTAFANVRSWSPFCRGRYPVATEATDVGCAAGGKAHDDTHRSRRIILRAYGWRRNCKRGSSC